MIRYYTIIRYDMQGFFEAYRGQNRRSPLGISGGAASRPTAYIPPAMPGALGHSCRIKGAPQQARVLAALRAAPACRGRFAPLTRHPLAGSVPPLFRVLSPLRGPRLAASIIAPGHTSLDPRFTSLSGHRPAMFSGPCVGPPFFARSWWVINRVGALTGDHLVSLRNGRRGVFKTLQTLRGVQASENAP